MAALELLPGEHRKIGEVFPFVMYVYMYIYVMGARHDVVVEVVLFSGQGCEHTYMHIYSSFKGQTGMYELLGLVLDCLHLGLLGERKQANLYTCTCSSVVSKSKYKCRECNPC